MKTLQEDWEEYRRMVYPNEVSAALIEEARSAFFACASVVLSKVRAAEKLPGSLESVTDGLARDVMAFREEELRSGWVSKFKRRQD